jgi:hypothetical protein
VPANRTWSTDAYTLIYHPSHHDAGSGHRGGFGRSNRTKPSRNRWYYAIRACQALLTATGEPADKIGYAAGDSRLAAYSYWNGIPPPVGANVKLIFSWRLAQTFGTSWSSASKILGRIS